MTSCTNPTECLEKPTVADGKEQRTYPLRQLYFYLTEGCNLKCRHCWIAPKYQAPDKAFSALDPNLFRSIIAEAKPMGLNGIKFTGGEPLLHPKISELIEIVRTEELRLKVETNGVLCTPELAVQLKGASKNTFVSVSIDGAKAETHEWVRGVEGSFDAAWQGVRNLVQAGFKPQVIMSIMRRNNDEMEAVVRLAEQNGAGSVKFNLVQPTARGEAMHEANETLSIQELIDLGAWVEHTLSKTTTLRLLYSHPMAFRPLGKMFGDNGEGCGLCGILGILGVLANGSYALCGIGETVPDMVFGHAATNRLEEVWKTSAVLNELREGFPAKLKGICGDCLMKGICLGSCVAQNYYSSKDLWAPFWYCEEARTAGLFPETRLKP
ncbi:MAG: SynChlorMet cassette radical SAM/SPASM protein ScmF [Chlorobiaceae bacterium]|nr:SynChlorMet cassette radical SAM/SPASM protein ScmF [Chlorobiaceae bacterium]